MKTPEARRRLSGSRRSRFQPETMSAPSSSRSSRAGMSAGSSWPSPSMVTITRPLALGEAGRQRRRLTEVAPQPHPRSQGRSAGDPLDQLEGAVGGAVVDDDHLPIRGPKARRRLLDLLQQGWERLALVEGGDDHREVDLGAHRSLHNPQRGRGSEQLPGRVGVVAGSRSSAGDAGARSPTGIDAAAKRRTATGPPAPGVLRTAPPGADRSTLPCPREPHAGGNCLRAAGSVAGAQRQAERRRPGPRRRGRESALGCPRGRSGVKPERAVRAARPPGRQPVGGSPLARRPRRRGSESVASMPALSAGRRPDRHWPGESSAAQLGP